MEARKCLKKKLIKKRTVQRVSLNAICSANYNKKVNDKNYTRIISILSQCFYLPKCRMDRVDLQAEVQRVKKILETKLGSNSSCITDSTGHPRDVILRRKYTLEKALFALLWPCVMLGGGALLVGLVKLTQCLAHLSSEMCSESAGSRLTSRYTQGKLYRLLQRSSMQSPS